jgi:vacuolar-type H+-ATPase subunit E/Vma4
VREHAREKLVDIISCGDKYKTIMEGLMTQCLCQLTEDNVEIRCREQDTELVKVFSFDCELNEFNVAQSTIA